MTNFIEKLKQVAAGRTKGHWAPDWNQSYGNGTFSLGPVVVAPEDEENPAQYENSQVKKDAQFIALAANCFDELVAVAAAAMEVSKRHDWMPELGMCICDEHSNFNAAIRRLRQKVEGEGG